jgi:DNA processing protein
MHRRLMDYTGGEVHRVFNISEKELGAISRVSPEVVARIVRWKDHLNWDEECALIAQMDLKLWYEEDAAYPELLRNIGDPPLLLYVQGSWPLDQRYVAVVGTRNPSYYGARWARRIGAELARRGFTVVSGLARGVDAEAHLGALDAGGSTVAVLGSGLQHVYPAEHRHLARRILTSNGGLISEYPIQRKADRGAFPRRNRIVAGMCEAVIVVESAAKGGSMITAGFAADYGKTVFALPGQIDQSAAEGCHQLIRDGAILISKMDDLWEELKPLIQLIESAEPAQNFIDSFDSADAPDVAQIVSTMQKRDLWSVDEIVEVADLPAYRVGSLLVLMELKGIVLREKNAQYHLQ